MGFDTEKINNYFKNLERDEQISYFLIVLGLILIVIGFMVL